MKKYFLLFFTLLLVLWGCNKQDGILEPSQNSKLVETVKMNDSQNLQFISLPMGLSKSSGSTSLSTSERISGSRGGDMELEYSERHLEIKAYLKIPSGAFSGTKELSMELSNTSTEVTFGPSMKFATPLHFDLKYEGLDLKGINPNSIRFAYLSPTGQYEFVSYDKLEVNIKDGILKVEGAAIPHFSRFGFCR